MLRKTRRSFSWRNLFKATKSKAMATLRVEPMEQRALMAFTPLANFAAINVTPIVQTGPSFTFITQNRSLILSLEAFLTDLESAYGPNGTGANSTASANVQGDLNQISTLAGPTNTQAVSKLSGDVSVISNAGTITTPERQTLLADLTAIAINSGIPVSVVSASANQILGVSNTTPSTVATRTDLTDPNAIGTSRASENRGQGSSSSSIALLPPGTGGPAMPDNGFLGASFRKLLADMKAELGKSKAITPAQVVAVRNDFAAVTTASHRPAANTVANLRADLDAINAAGKITDADRARVQGDLTSVFQSAGVSNGLVSRTIADFQPILNAADLDPTALTKVLGDLANVLAARPRTISPVGSWWLGGLPR